MFDLAKTQEKLIKGFKEEHKDCAKKATNDKAPFSYEFNSGCTGTASVIKCNVCGESLDLLERIHKLLYNMENKETPKTNTVTMTAVEEPTKKEVKKEVSNTKTEVKEPVKETEKPTTQEANKEENELDGDLKELIGEGKYNISAPLFLMFAEYLGYVGKTLPWVDQWCVDKKKPEPYKVKFIEVEAVTVLKEAKKKFTEKKLRELYDSLYEVILFIYDNNLKEMDEKTNKD